jgi:glycyl-tRNA synthetase beta chain
VPGLGKVVYHNKLGTQGERTERVRAIAKVIGAQLGSDHLAHEADIAARLAKADLLTDMVGEFPELQGIMGSYYALNDGLSAEIADAIEDHYKPRFAGDTLPRNPIGIVAALADKLETLAGLFAIGQLPSGDKDPFALRRHALGVVRMLMEKDLPLQFDALVTEALGLFPQATADTATQLSDFIYERLAGILREQGYSATNWTRCWRCGRSGWAMWPSAWRPCAPSRRCPRRRRWPPPTSASAIFSRRPTVPSIRT